jgi:hypothetical protein
MYDGYSTTYLRMTDNSRVAGVVFQHESIELLQRELSRNPSLLQACGFNVS